MCQKYGINYQKGGTIFQCKPDDIEEIVSICKEHNIPYENGGNVFFKRPDEVRKVIEVCQKHNIPYQKGGSIFRKNADEIESIVEICEKHGVDYRESNSVFQNKPEVTEEIIEICKDNGIECKGTVFSSNPRKLTESINYVRENYGEGMVQRLIIVQNPDRLKQVLPYFEEHGYLEGLLKGTLVLSLTLEEFKERERILQSRGEEVLIDGKFNPIFGLDRKRYNKKFTEEIKTVKASSK